MVETPRERALIFQGAEQPNGYTEPLLHGFRAGAKDNIFAEE